MMEYWKNGTLGAKAVFLSIWYDGGDCRDLPRGNRDPHRKPPLRRAVGVRVGSARVSNVGVSSILAARTGTRTANYRHESGEVALGRSAARLPAEAPSHAHRHFRQLPDPESDLEEEGIAAPRARTHHTHKQSSTQSRLVVVADS